MEIGKNRETKQLKLNFERENDLAFESDGITTRFSCF